MQRLVRLSAICLALAFAFMLFSPPVGVADGPRSYCMDSGPTGGDGHPWDDGTGQESTPDDDGTIQPQEKTLINDPSVQPVLMAQKGVVSWTQRGLISLWYKVRDLALTQKTVTKVASEYKTKRSRPVQ